MLGVSLKAETKAKSITYKKTTEGKTEPVWPVWRKWAVLEKEPEAYTREDIEAASGFNSVMQGDIRTLVDRQRQTLDELCRDVITNKPTKTRKLWTKAEIDEIVNIL